MIETQKAEENICNLSVFDATDRTELFNETISSGDDAKIISENLTLEMDSDFGMEKTMFNELDETFEWGDSQNNEFDLHVKDNSLKMHIGANKNQETEFGIGTITTESLDLESVNVQTVEDSEEAIDSIDQAQKKVVNQRSQLGAIQNRLEKSISVSENTVENVINAESQIRDADMAKEAMMLAKQQILVQSSQAMLSQANQLLSSGFEGIKKMMG
jgi:flagellin-like hook-associated protein FlgL